VEASGSTAGGGLAFQRMLQSQSHAERLGLFAEVVDNERRRLATRASLRAMFGKKSDAEE
jgi:hypothetical protein